MTPTLLTPDTKEKTTDTMIETPEQIAAMSEFSNTTKRVRGVAFTGENAPTMATSILLALVLAVRGITKQI